MLTLVFGKTDVNMSLLTSILKKTDVDELMLFTRMLPGFC